VLFGDFDLLQDEVEIAADNIDHGDTPRMKLKKQAADDEICSRSAGAESERRPIIPCGGGLVVFPTKV